MDNLKKRIDIELNMLKMTDDMKRKTRVKYLREKPRKPLKWVVAFLTVLVMGGTTVFAGYYVTNRNVVNSTELPRLDDMYIVKMNKLPYKADEYGITEEEFHDYKTIKGVLGIPLLDSELSKDNPYLMAHLRTDNKDFATITVDNYILGDTYDYKYNLEENRYDYQSGKDFHSPISLSAVMILSENQLEIGWNADYLGMYSFVEQYTSEKGYKVNVIEITDVEDTITPKCAIFVADGIRYTVKGMVSLEMLKEIINSMEV